MQSIVGGIFGEIEEKESCDCIPFIVEEMVGVHTMSTICHNQLQMAYNVKTPRFPRSTDRMQCQQTQPPNHSFLKIDDIACIYSLRNGWGRLWSSYSLCS
jgi:hypothetical protein